MDSVTKAVCRLAAIGTYDARATVGWSGFGGTVASASGMLAAATADATEHCAVCRAIRGNVAMQVTAEYMAP